MATITPFTPARSCTTDIYTHAGVGGQNYFSIGGPSPSACFPPGWTSTASHFSPGICPVGYTEACANIIAAVTSATCCPSGFQCYTLEASNFAGQKCISRINALTTRVVTSGVQELLVTMHPVTEAVNGYGVSIEYRAADFPTQTSSGALESSSQTASGSSSQTPTIKPTSTPTPIPTSAPGGEEGNGGISTGAKLGIGLGVAGLVVLGLTTALFYLWRRRRSRDVKEIEKPGFLPELSGERMVREVYAPFGKGYEGNANRKEREALVEMG